MLHAFHEGLREIAMWRERGYSAAAAASSTDSDAPKTSSDKHEKDGLDENLWARWELAFEYLG